MPIKLITKDENGLLLSPIPKKMMMDMIDEYMKTTHDLSTKDLQRRFPNREFPNRVKFNETHSAWVSRQEINELLDENDGNGMRIYYGCHDKSTNADAKLDYLAMHNLILVATRDDVDPLNPTTQNSKDQLHESEDKSKANSIITSGLFPVEAYTGPYTGQASDLLPLCPPHCPKP